MEIDKSHWSKIWPHPYSPSNEDVEIYFDNMIGGTTLLLGCTRQLLRYTDRQLDLDPFIEGYSVIKGNWKDNRHFYTNILIDGGLCFSKELCDDILDMASRNCLRFITRSFNRKLDDMKVASYFPTENDFNIKPNKTIVFQDYSFYVWYFRK